jgi:hypothetical protein
MCEVTEQACEGGTSKLKNNLVALFSLLRVLESPGVHTFDESSLVIVEFVSAARILHQNGQDERSEQIPFYSKCTC